VERVKELISKSYLINSSELSISFQTKRLGKTILELHNISKSYPDTPLFTNIEHVFQAKERIGILGPNGCGKTTLIRILTGEESPDSGSVKLGVNTSFAYYKQDQEDMNARISVLDYVNQFADVVKTADGKRFSASEMLQRFLFDGKMQQMPVSALSGGEKKRLHLMVSLMFGSNFLILDEPTNDLDIRTLEILEDYLDAYRGCIVVVSHDRYFLDRICDDLFIFENGGIRKFAGNYSDYFLVKRFLEEENELQAGKDSKRPVYRAEKNVKVLSWKEEQEMLNLEQLIEQNEAQISRLETDLHAPDKQLSYEDYALIGSQLETLQAANQQALLRWSELAEKA
jgi:ATP-binding cassette subfamily F protein uup